MAVVKVIRLSPQQKGKGREDGAVQEFRAVVGRGYGRSQTASLCPLQFQKGSWLLEEVIGGLWHFALYVEEAKRSVTGQSKTLCLGSSL